VSGLFEIVDVVSENRVVGVDKSIEVRGWNNHQETALVNIGRWEKSRGRVTGSKLAPQTRVDVNEAPIKGLVKSGGPWVGLRDRRKYECEFARVLIALEEPGVDPGDHRRAHAGPFVGMLVGSLDQRSSQHVHQDLPPKRVA
jgi:hypothetical protein